MVRFVAKSLISIATAFTVLVAGLPAATSQAPNAAFVDISTNLHSPYFWQLDVNPYVGIGTANFADRCRNILGPGPYGSPVGILADNWPPLWLEDGVGDVSEQLTQEIVVADDPTDCLGARPTSNDAIRIGGLKGQLYQDVFITFGYTDGIASAFEAGNPTNPSTATLCKVTGGVFQPDADNLMAVALIGGGTGSCFDFTSRLDFAGSDPGSLACKATDTVVFVWPTCIKLSQIPAKGLEQVCYRIWNFNQATATASLNEDHGWVYYDDAGATFALEWSNVAHWDASTAESEDNACI